MLYFLRNLTNCYNIINQKLPSTNFLISVIADSFYGNGESTKQLQETVSGGINGPPIVIDTHRYLNWGFIPSFNAQNASNSLNAIKSGQNTYDVPNTLSYNAPWKNYKSIQGEWSIAINNNGDVPTADEAANLFGSQIDLIRSQSNLLGGCYWMLRAGYGLVYNNNLIQYKPNRAWNNSGEAPGDPWQNNDWVWSYANLMFKYPKLWSVVTNSSTPPASSTPSVPSVSSVPSTPSTPQPVPSSLSNLTACTVNADSKGYGGVDPTGKFVPNGNISLESCGNKCTEDSSCTYYKSGPGQWCELFYGNKFSTDAKWNDFVSQVDSGKFGKFQGGGGVKYYTGITPDRCKSS